MNYMTDLFCRSVDGQWFPLSHSPGAVLEVPGPFPKQPWALPVIGLGREYPILDCLAQIQICSAPSQLPQ